MNTLRLIRKIIPLTYHVYRPMTVLPIAVATPGKIPHLRAHFHSNPSSSCTTELSEEEKKKLREEKKKAKEAEKLEKEKKKEANRANRGAQNKDVPKVNYLDVEKPDVFFGDYTLMKSQGTTGRKWANIGDLDESLAEQAVWVRGRMYTIREKGKGAFIVLREAFSTAQATLFVDDQNGITKDFIKFASSIPSESIVDCFGVVNKVPTPIESCSQKNVELSLKKLFVVSRSTPNLPFCLEDASRSEKDFKEAENDPSKQYVRVNMDTRLNNRVIDLRTTANQAIFRIQSGIGQLFREKLTALNFIEFHSPKIIGGTSEGGSEVFRLSYFNNPACLAQSPQLYKQMAVVADLGRVFEIGPVFRAENSQTHRHLCEFVGLDLEMSFREHYHEVLEVMDELFVYIFDGLNARYSKEIEAVQAQYPFEPLKYLPKTLRINYEEGISLLRGAGYELDDFADINTEMERKLGGLVRAKYNTDFYVLDRFPAAIRPFYTMPASDDERYANAYDIMLRGEEIMSGAQRVHDPELLIEQANKKGIAADGIKAYVDSFRYGSYPHAGGGIGLERVTMLFLGLHNIRLASMFPRDPSRLAP